jgi:hypothetical protein
MESLVLTEPFDTVRFEAQLEEVLDQWDMEESGVMVIYVYAGDERIPFMSLTLEKASNFADVWVLLDEDRSILAGFTRMTHTTREIAEEISSRIPAYASRIEIEVAEE